MQCIDKSLEPGEDMNRIYRYSVGEMGEKERNEFEQHIFECEHCYQKCLNEARVSRILKINYSYEKFLREVSEENWEEVLRLADELESLGNREDLCPIDDDVALAKVRRTLPKKRRMPIPDFEEESEKPESANQTKEKRSY